MTLHRLARVACLAAACSFPAQAAEDDWAKPLRALASGDAKPLAATAERKAERGDYDAQRLLSVLYRDGIGVARDPAQSDLWLRKAGDAGHPVALALLCEGQGTNAADPRACERAAALGVPSAQTATALARLVRGAPASAAREQIALLEKAAEADDPLAQVLLGVRFYDGLGVPADELRAAELWRRALRQGEPAAFRLLGQAHIEGRGVARDVKEGLRLLQDAAERGDARAQFLLGIAYAGGLDVQPDPARAYRWLMLAERRLSGSQQEEAARRRDAVQARLGDKERRDAEAAAAAFRPELLPLRTPNPGRLYVERLQQRLKTGGVDVGPASGVLDDRTAAALEAFLGRYGVRSPRVDALALVGAALNVWQEDGGSAQPLKPATYGTGFFVSAEGHIVTSLHVVESCSAVRAEGLGLAREVLRDDASDLVLLKARAAPPAVATFRRWPDARQGESVYVFGYPLRRILASEPIITQGMINALAGVGDDPRQIQISAEVQPGNSGGPVLDRSGLVVGVVAARMRDDLVMQGLGIIPQNINFALKLSYVSRLLQSAGLAISTSLPAEQPLSSEEIAERARAFTVPIECLR